MSKLHLILVLFLLFSCEAPESDLNEKLDSDNRNRDYDSGPRVGGRSVSYVQYNLPMANAKGSLGGIDFKIDSHGVVHAAYAIKYLDVELGGDRYALVYAHNRHGSFTSRMLRTEQSKFYKTGKHVRLVLDEREDVIISYLSSDRSIKVLEESESFSGTTYQSNVYSYELLYDTSTQNLHLGFFSSIYSDYNYHLMTYNKKRYISSTSHGNGIRPDSGSNHIEMHLYNGQVISLFKVYNQVQSTGQFILIKDGTMYVLANGVNATGIFNAYMSGGELYTCYRDVLKKRYKLRVRLYNMSGLKNYARFDREYTSPYHCAVADDPDLPVMRYNDYNYYGSTYLEYYSFANRSDGRHYPGPIKNFEKIGFYQGNLWFVGLSTLTGAPVLLKKR